ncbi:MAG: ribulose-phosphate 3-epimerase [Candidatus Muiribacteriota bacterium]
MMLVAPSILSSDFNILGEEVNNVKEAGADWIHVDVMDGHYVPNITIGPVVIKNLKKISENLILDCHLMITNPDKYIESFVEAGADIITVHSETCPHLNKTLNYIKELGIKAGVTYNPATSMNNLKYIKDIVDVVLIMSVNPGFSGQKFIPSSLEKIKEVRQICPPHVKIQVDGGINNKNIADIKKAGADVVVAGSYIFGSDNYREKIESLKRG